MYETNFDLTGRTALVTGGNSGLGAQISRVLTEAGARVFIVSRTGIDPETGAHLDADSCLIADITHADTPRRAFEAAGQVDILVNCAGASLVERAELTSASDFNSVVNVNLVAAQNMSVSFVEHLRKRKTGGVILHISSILATQTMRGSAAYAASKAGLDQLTRVQALEWGKYGIRVNSIAPGWFETPLTSGLLSGPAGSVLRQKNPLSRLGKDGDLDGAVLLLTSDAGRYINGVILPVDGGQSLGS